MKTLKNWSVKPQKPPKLSSRARNITYFYFGLLALMSLGQLLSLSEFVAALDQYQIGNGSLWASILLGLQLLALPALLPLKLSKAFRNTSAWAGLILPILWSFLAIQALIRGIELDNCGCFGKYLAQPMTLWVLLQDVFFIFYGVFSFTKTRIK